MNRGAWWATVHDTTRVGHDLAPKPPPPPPPPLKHLQEQKFQKRELGAGCTIK